jgi:hypothetical protein
MALKHSWAGVALLVAVIAGCTVTTGSTNNCSPDSAVGCKGISVGYSCTGGQTPAASNSSLNCSMGVQGNAGSMLYCCETFSAASAASSCAPDTAVTSCPAGAAGYSCTGSGTPPQSNPSLSCGSGTSGGAGTTRYCCTRTASVDAGGSCSPAAGPSGCAANSTEYTCTGSVTPVQSNPLLSCGPGIVGMGGATLYCCAPIDAGTTSGSCVQDSTVQNCAPNTTGYSCTGAATPVQINPLLTCAASPASGGTTAYCCGSSVGAVDAGSTDAGACAVGAATGSAACDQCLTSQCCNALVACATPDSAGVNDAGASACEQLLGCVLDCVAGNADAGVAPGTSSQCQMICDPIYTPTEQQNASAVLSCQTSSCASMCQ